MIEKLATLPEGEGTVPDHCQIAFGSGISWGRLHNCEDIPLVAAGRDNGMIRGGRHVRYPGEAVANRVPIMTTLRGADAALRAIRSLQKNEVQVKALQEYH